MPPDIDSVVAKYVELRTRRAALKKQFESDDKVLVEAMDKLAEWLGNSLTKATLTSAKTDSGTVFWASKDRLQITDYELLKAYIKENDRFDLFERRISKNVGKEIMDQNRDGTFNNPPPPGTDYVRWKEIQVRKN